MPVPVTCHACNATFRIPDALYAKHFEGREGKIWCKKCKTLICVDGRRAAGPAKLVVLAEKVPSTPPRVLSTPKSPSAPARSLSPTSLGAVTLAVVEPSSPEPADAKADEPVTPGRSLAEAAPSIDHTPTPFPIEPPPALRPAAKRKRWPALLAVGAALATAAAVYPRGEGRANAPAKAAVAVATPTETQPPTPEAVSELAAPPVVRDPEPVVASEPAIVKPRHDEAALNRALRWGVGQAENCHRGGRASGTAHVAVRFAPSGRVTSAVIDDEAIANAPVGKCIVAYMKAMIIPPFEGTELEIGKDISLR